MTHIYRIQDAEGRGPWKPGFSGTWMDQDIGNRAKMLPLPFDRKMVRVGEIPMYGCRTEEQLRRWITPTEYARLVELGYESVIVISARVIHEDENQVLACVRPPIEQRIRRFELHPRCTA